MIDRFVACRSVDTADKGISRIVPKRNLSCALDATEVVSNGLTDQERERNAPASRLKLELPVRVFRESKIRRHVSWHDGITISRYRWIVNDNPGRCRGSRTSRTSTAALATLLAALIQNTKP